MMVVVVGRWEAGGVGRSAAVDKVGSTGGVCREGEMERFVDGPRGQGGRWQVGPACCSVSVLFFASMVGHLAYRYSGASLLKVRGVGSM